MPQGLRIFDENGDVVIDTSARLGRILGTTTISGSDGDVTNSGFGDGDPFWMVMRKISGGGSVKPPRMTFSGTTLSWTYDGVSSGLRQHVILIYGVF